MDILNMVKKYCKETKIEPKGIILHGSQAVGFANVNSDYDILLILDETEIPNMDVFIMPQGEKVQIEFICKNELEKKLSQYEKRLFQTTLDLNILEGRILQGKIIYATEDIINAVKRYKRYVNKTELVKKYIYLAMNAYTDSKVNDVVLKDYSYNNILIFVGTAILIKNDYFWLTPKWQHMFLKQILEQKDYELYVKLRKKRGDYEGFIVAVDKLINRYIEIIV